MGPDGARKVRPKMAFVTNAAEAKCKLEEIVQRNLAHSGGVVQRAMAEVITDDVVRALAMRFEVPAHEGDQSKRRVQLQLPGRELVLHPHALRQVADRAGVPARGVPRLEEGRVPPGGHGREVRQP